ncbi:MAG: type II toxin-antitoxin system RelE/ParE family toxin [Ostreibacterium sp.]
MIIRQSGIFCRRIKRLSKQAKQILDKVIKNIAEDLDLGDLKIGDLAGVRVYKYQHENQQYLLAYEYHAMPDTLDLLSHGTHENFYRDLKRSI